MLGTQWFLMGIDGNYRRIDGNYREIDLIRGSHPPQRKKYYSRIPFTLDPGKKILKKKSKKIEKIKKPLSDIIFSQNGMRQAEKERKKYYSRILFTLDLGKKIPRKIAKKLKKVKNLFPILFLDKTGRDRPRKREKNITPEFCSHSTQARKFRKNQQKN